MKLDFNITELTFFLYLAKPLASSPVVSIFVYVWVYRSIHILILVQTIITTLAFNNLIDL